MRVDYINGLDEFDGELWFFDGKYVGHDDQIDARDFAAEGTTRTVDFHHRTIRAGVDYMDLIEATQLDEIESSLNEETPSE